MAVSKVTKGIIWASVQRFGTMIISFVTNIALARILAPDDFGTIGMLLLFMVLANTFVDSGFASALIQKKDADSIDYSTVFYINIGLSFLVYFFLFCGAPLVAGFYGIDILCLLLRVEGLVLFLNAFCTVQTAIFQKKMDFKILSICNLIGNIFGSILSIIVALNGFGVWSLVVRLLVSSLVIAIIMWLLSTWRPILTFSTDSFRELFSFGGFMLLSRIVYSISNNIQTVVIGKLFTPSTLGLYTQARQLRSVASDSISSIISQVFYPDFAIIQNDNKALTLKLNFSILMISFVTVALMMLCIVCASPLVVFLYGEKWTECIPYFQLLCFGGCFVSLQDININIVAAKGKSKILFYFNICKICIFFFLMIVGAKIGGIYGLLISMIFYSIISYLCFAGLACYYLECKIWGQLKNVTQIFILSLAPMGVTFFLNISLADGFPNYIILIIDFVVFAFVYSVIAYYTNNKAFLFLKEMIYHHNNKVIK